MKKPILIRTLAILGVCSCLFAPGLTYAESPRANNPSACPKSATHKVDGLDLYTVNDGELRKLTIKGDDIGKGPISVEGYVCGAVLFCGADATAMVDGKRMVRADKTKDENSSKHPSAAERLSCFPLVKGDAISPNNDFLIAVQSGNEVLEIPVQHRGYQILTTDLGISLKYKIAFQYLGSKSSMFESENFENRLRAVAEGIDAVQRTFDIHLVRTVNIIDYEGIENAVTKDDEGGIWFYAKALRNEPLDELKIMAEHETLHLLVEKKRLTKSSQLRELFADLKGFDELSYERLLLLSKGVTTSNRESDKNNESVFFSFIDERNFIAGMKGGHSHENLAEFCTSFFHSLMYLHRFGHNLETLLVPERIQDPSHLTLSDKSFILRTYLRAVEISIKTLNSSTSSISSAFPDTTKLLLEKGLVEIKGISLPPDLSQINSHSAAAN
jgi:hypothetical protein